ncbi:MAG: hypothetical protein Satyrvirus34_10 [Satyrvirus sp.]|uniref:Uncharacterized protein n=1 Tax=Satyrvirus sp. TaxID=2487771 RepID=A0A3G5AEW9_9VIRU|nr:MAG: hypothetical protein Satyrvirus34_10 [Satyrvirus sp.]
MFATNNNCEIVKLRNCEIVKLRNCEIAKLRNCEICVYLWLVYLY